MVNFLILNKAVHKKAIFKNYIKNGTITDEEWKFCEKIDWHPVDELPLKEKHIKELKKSVKEKSLKLKSIEEIFKSK
ncbi:MAG TPA: hypothetical protein VJJ23_05030 [Candidatus Nanoarchaeia archaeon]|nr:hypothetical protein [Candidatus Nanoarchaeia archaeon]